jgi:hypothetical protein
MLKAASSARTDTADIVIAMAVAALGAAAICFPAVLLKIAPPCLITLIIDDVCWGCGITRAASAFLRADFAAAWSLNRLSVVVMPMLIGLYARHLWRIWQNRLTPKHGIK